jgi:signal transduction histidine kinase
MRAAPALIALALSGCTLLDPLTPAPAPPPAPATQSASSPSSSAEELVAYLARLKSLDERARNAEAERQRQGLQGDSTDLARVKAAMAMTVAGQSEESEILALVDPVVTREGRNDPDTRAMAGFLQGIAHDRRRLKESAAAAGNRMRDAQKARETEKQRADALQERAAQLQQKLDALADLEKSLSERPNPPR